LYLPYCLFQRFRFVGFFPGELGAAKMPVGSGLLENGAAEVQGLDDSRGTQIKNLFNGGFYAPSSTFAVPKVSTMTETGNGTPMA